MARPMRTGSKSHFVVLGSPAHIELERAGPHHYRATVGNRTFELDAQFLPDGSLSLLIGDHSHVVSFVDGGVLIRQEYVSVEVADERNLSAVASARGEPEGRYLITAPMPGKVVKIFVALGDAVKLGQPLVVIEAMKMENELKAPGAGIVAQVNVAELSNVEKGTLLLRVEQA